MPLSLRKCPPGVSRSRARAQRRGLAIRVVAVDDQARARFLVVSVVDELGYDVVAEANDGAKAVQQVSEHSPDVVVMDFQMPVMDGLEATRQIKTRYPDVQVVAYTSTDDPAIRQGFLDAGACDHVEKGDLERLIAALSRCGAGRWSR